MLDLEYPENNPNGMFVVQGTDVQVKNSLMNTITLYKPLADPRDRTKTEASLLQDLSGIEIKEPSVPTFFFNEGDDIHELDSAQEQCSKTKLAHSVACTAIQSQVHRQSKRVVLKFPDGMTCNKDYFNNPGDSFKLKKHFRILPVTLGKEKSSGNSIESYVAFVYWKVVIDGTEKLLAPDKDGADPEEDLQDAFDRMSKMNVNP